MGLELDLSSEQRQNLPSGGEAFLDELSEALDSTAIKSVLLFGSVVSGEATEVSDIDLLVVFKDSTEDSHIRSVQERCLHLAETHLEAERTKGNQIDNRIDGMTGMFRSGFVVRGNAINSGAFHSIFHTSRLAYLLAPWRTVLAAVFDSSTALYGPLITPNWEKVEHPLTRPRRELLRSLVMTLMLSISQIFYSMVSTRSILYAMEAHKWTLYNCAFHLGDERTESLHRASNIVPGCRKFDRQLFDLREDPHLEIGYMRILPIYILLVHIRTVIALR